MTARKIPEHDRLDDVVTLETALAASMDDGLRWYRDAVNPPAVADTAMLGLSKRFVHAEGATLVDEDGVTYLDCLAGFGSVNLGHNHPEVLEALDRVASLPNLLQIWPQPVTPGLAVSLTAIAPGSLGKVFLCNSGTEAVEAGLKLARASTGRTGFLSTMNAFHGKSFGALSVSGREHYRTPFEPLLPGCDRVAYGDVDDLAERLRTRRYAAFVVEPIQGEGGVVVPPPGYLSAVQELCRESGTLLVVDEVQTGLGRTGRLFACEYDDVEPDVLCLAKGLSGGVMPIGACLATTEAWERAYGRRDSATLHTSTFGGNTRACAAALKTIEILLRDDLAQRAARLGSNLLERLRAVAAESTLIADVRGRGLLIGVEFAASRVASRFSEENAGGIAAALLLQDHRILTINTLNQPNVLRIEPPLTITEDEVDRVVAAVEALSRRHRGILGATTQVSARAVRRHLSRSRR